MAVRTKKVVKCNNCGRNITVKTRTKRQGDIEYKFFACRRCGAVYMISATDGKLREDIERYTKLVQEVESAPEVNEEKTRQAAALLRANIERSRQIQEEHPYRE